MFLFVLSPESVASRKLVAAVNVFARGDVWRIDDEWWRERISRRYFRVTLAGGVIRVLYQDLVTGAWYEQQY